MKTFTTTLFAILLICTTSVVFAQDEIYNEKTKKIVVMDSIHTNKTLIVKKDSLKVDANTTKDVGDAYYTEEDYYNEKYGENYQNEGFVVFTEDEVKETPPSKKNNEGLRIITEVVAEVFVNVILTFALFH